MQKRDYLMDEIQRIGKIIADLLLHLKKEPTPENIISTQEFFLEKLNLSIKELIAKDEFTLQEFLKNSTLTFDQQENIAEYLLLCSEAENEAKTKLKYLTTAKNLLNYINTKTQSISFARMALEEKINTLLGK